MILIVLVTDHLLLQHLLSTGSQTMRVGQTKHRGQRVQHWSSWHVGVELVVARHGDRNTYRNTNYQRSNIVWHHQWSV